MNYLGPLGGVIGGGHFLKCICDPPGSKTMEPLVLLTPKILTSMATALLNLEQLWLPAQDFGNGLILCIKMLNSAP